MASDSQSDKQSSSTPRTDAEIMVTEHIFVDAAPLSPLATIRDAALEEAAKVCDELMPRSAASHLQLQRETLENAAMLIRALKGNAAPKVEPVSKPEHGTLDAQAGSGPAESAFHPCTCHPDDNPPRPCPQKFALSECRKAAHRAKVEAEIQDAWERESLSDLCLIARRLLWAA